MFQPVNPKQNFVALEHEMLDFWVRQKIFEKLRRQLAGKPRWSFLDGPITANNPMGVHHAWGRTLKDVFQRYFAMRGFNQRWQNGFDCQGLWVEVEVEKELKFKTKKDIEKFGIGKFVEKCKERVRKYSAIQTKQSVRLGQWMDWKNSYYTMSDENNFAIWHFLKTCHEKGDLYKGRDSVPWCPRCGTAISQHEILSEEYKALTHQAIYFKLPIVERPGECFLVWTTTPWTIPANVALAVNPDFEYGTYEKDGEKLVMFNRLAEKVLGRDWKETGKNLGARLVGLHYRGPFDDLPRVQEARKANGKTFHSVVDSSELVTAEEGTGIVHIAPGAGTEDFQLGKEKDLPVIEVIDESAVYLDKLGKFSGQSAKEHPEIILDYLKEQRTHFVKVENYTHRYPTCWRCKDELVWRVVDEWYISMDKLRRQMMTVSKKINWIPSFGLERELDWLKNMHDWLISKKRYWGLALPIWECACGHFEVIGSREELEKKAVAGWNKFDGHSPHKPWIDEVKIKCPKCGKLVSRVPDVGNPWLDAGIVPFSTMGYFQDKRYWKKWFPADFICESFPGQFKNWFYSLIAMSTVLENTNPFQTVLGYATVKDEKGEEMHKSKGNAIWFDDAAEKIGVDVMRWMYCAQQPELNLRFGYHSADEVRRKLLLLWNVYVFFVTYANIDKPKLSVVNRAPRHKLDRWILSALHELIGQTNVALPKYDQATVVTKTEKFIDSLANWYVRRSRRRFWKSESDTDKAEAYQVLFTVLITLTKLLAPFIPFLTEAIYQNIRKQDDPESVHLAEYPHANPDQVDEKLNHDVDLVLQIVRLGRAAREQGKMKVRQPLGQMLVAGGKVLEELVAQVKEELNVKEVKFIADAGKYVTKRIRLNFPVLGKKYGPDLPAVQSALARGYEKTDSGELKVGKFTLAATEFSEELVARAGWAVVQEGAMSVILDLNLTPALRSEGLARELIRVLQDMRKEADYQVADRIMVSWTSQDPSARAVLTDAKQCQYIAREVLAKEIIETKTEDRLAIDLEKEIELTKAGVTNLGIKR